MQRGILVLLMAFGLAACSGEAPEPAVGEAVEERGPGEELAAIVEEFFEEYLELNPVYATFVGDGRYNDRLANSISPEHREASRKLEETYLKRIGELDPHTLQGQDLLSYEIFRNARQSSLLGFVYPDHLLPVNQFFSLPTLFPRLGSGGSAQPFDTVEDYENFLGRIDGFVVWVDQALVNMDAGIESGIVQPRVVIEKALPQLEAQVVDDVEQSIFYRPVANMPEAIAGGERERLTEAYRRAISGQLVPAYRKLADYLREQYLPNTRDTVGLGSLPGGREWYDYLVAQTTTTKLTAEEIHAIGLAEVERIRGEMLSVMERVGFEGSLTEFFDYLKNDRQFFFDDAEELLAAYRSLKERVAARVPEQFSLIPAADFEIRAVEEFRQRSAAPASYSRPAPDGSRPGIFYVNTYDVESRARYQVESIYVHEAVPGHHFQIALAQELEELPRFRRFGGNTAYVEGWGLYAESLGRALGLYEDPYSYYGALLAEMWRAIRLVVDTGMHARGWTREQALEFMRANSSLGDSDMVAEVERYIAIPSQALAYKIGQLEIQGLKSQAESALGEDFDIRAFHAEVLESGALPLDVLEAKLQRWIDSQRR